jgi:hypothetical protein
LAATRVLTPAKTFLQVEGADSENIIVEGGDLKKAMNTIAFGNGGNKNSVSYKS